MEKQKGKARTTGISREKWLLPVVGTILWLIYIAIMGWLDNFNLALVLQITFWGGLIIHAAYLVWNLPAGLLAIRKARKNAEERLE